MNEEPASGAPTTLYERVGGSEWFVSLVDRFYADVANDIVLRPLYPEDLTGSREHLASFLVQYWGGPTTYNDERGHPRLRMRHAPFTISAVERDHWFAHMAASVRAGGLEAADESQMLDYFERAAAHLVNDSPLGLVEPDS